MNDSPKSSDEFSDTTIPQPLNMSAIGFPSEEVANHTLKKTHSILSVLSTFIDLGSLDGVTISFDYAVTLATLDRGYETSHVLAPSKELAIGVAMTPSVIREGVLKSHIVLNGPYVLGIGEEEGEESEDFNLALHLLVHEAAHVEVTNKFDTAFPGYLLKHEHHNILDNLRWQVILACWDEYAVCRICKDIGRDPSTDYAETLISVLSETRATCEKRIIAYRENCELEPMIFKVFGCIGDLLKYSSYFLGAAKGIGHDKSQFDALSKALENHWYFPFWQKLILRLEALFDSYGSWKDFEKFEAIGDILEEIAEEIGIMAIRNPENELYFDIPYREETMPQ